MSAPRHLPPGPMGQHDLSLLLRLPQRLVQAVLTHYSISPRPPETGGYTRAKASHWCGVT